MFEKIAEWIGEKFNALRKYYNGFEVLELLGLVFGIAIVITVFALGIAAIIASGGTALAVIGVIAGILTISAVALNNYTNLGRAIGIVFNLFIDKGTPTYEKIGTALGLGLGLVVAIALVIVGWPVAVPLLAGTAVVLPWMIALIAFPLTVATFQGGGRFFGRLLDRYGPSLKEEINFKAKDESISSHLLTQKVLSNAKEGVYAYLRLQREHLDFWSQYFDKDTGVNRASTYLALLNGCSNDLQQAVIFYTLLTSNQGITLQETVLESMQCRNQDKAVAVLGEYINDYASKEDKTFIKESLIPKLHLFANSGEKPDKSNVKFRELMNNFKDLKVDNNRDTMDVTYSIQ